LALTVAVAFAALPPAAQAQVAVRAEVNATTVGVDDQVELAVVIEGRSIDLDHEPALLALDNLRLLSQPSVSTQVSIVNGAITQSRRYVYLLQPVQVGQAEIGAVRVPLRSGTRETAPITVTVVAGSVVPPRRAADPFADIFGPDPFEEMMGRRRAQPAGAILVEAAASRTSLYVGEPLLLTYYLLTQSRVSGVDFDGVPKYQGFWSEDLPRQSDAPQGTAITRNGQTFQRYPIFRRVLYPTKPGTLTIPATRFRIGVPRQIGIFADSVAPQYLSRASGPIEIEALPVPNDPGFSGAVGSFRVTSTLDRSQLSLGEAATLRFKVAGRGNLKWIERAPELAVAGAKVYPPQVKSDFTTSEAGVSGARTWEYVIVPETAGRLALPALSFSYFDPQEGRIVTASGETLALEVTPASAHAAAGPATAAAPASLSGLRLRSDLDLAAARLPRLGPGALAGAILAALLLHGALLAGGLAALRGSRGPSAAPRRSVRQALAELRRVERGGITKEAAALLIERTLVEVFGDIDERASDGGDKERMVREILREVRFVRYAPQLGDYSEKLREVAGRAADAVRKWA